MTEGARNHNGYFQVLNSYEEPDGNGGYRTRYRWQYVIIGFSDDDTCSVALWPNGYRVQPIDSKNRLTITGATGKPRKVGPHGWYH